jgi:phage I-like protein
METGSLFFPLDNKQGEVPKRIQLLPPGPVIEGRDGRKWIMQNARAVAEASNAWLPNHCIDENHAVDLKAPRGEESPAFGWFNNIRAEANGSVWADAEWTEKGKSAVSGLEYRYISPVILHNEKGEITAVARAALSNNPNLDIKSLNSIQRETPAEENNMKQILAALGLAETATENEAVVAIAALKTSLNAAQTKGVDLAAYAPRSDLAAMESRANGAEKQLAALNAEKLKTEGEAVIEQAIRDRKIAPANRELYMSLCATREELEKLRKIMAGSPAIIAEGARTPGGVPPGTRAALNAEESAMARSLGYSDEEWKKIREAGK